MSIYHHMIYALWIGVVNCISNLLCYLILMFNYWWKISCDFASDQLEAEKVLGDASASWRHSMGTRRWTAWSLTMEQYVLQQICRLAPLWRGEVEWRLPGGRDGAMAAGPGQADCLSLFICCSRLGTRESSGSTMSCMEYLQLLFTSLRSINL
jgi:hypothetical protein